MRRDRRRERAAAARRRVKRWLTVLSLVAFAAGGFAALPRQLGGRMTYVIVSGHSMEPTMHLGDLAVIRSAARYRIGEVIAYRVPGHAFDSGAVVIHRIVGGNAHTGFTTRGDNNNYNDPWHPHPTDALGTRVARVPGVGVAFSHLRGPLPLAAFAGLLGMIAAFEVAKPTRADRRRPKALGPTR
jgi:signal peptidase I